MSDTNRKQGENFMKNRKRWRALLLGVICLLPVHVFPVQAEEYWPEGPQIQGESAIVMEASTGTVLYEKNAHEHCYPASLFGYSSL